MATTTKPTLPQRRILEAMRDGATIDARRRFGKLERAYTLTTAPECRLSVLTFCKLVRHGWISSADDRTATHITYCIADAGRAAIA